MFHPPSHVVGSSVKSESSEIQYLKSDIERLLMITEALWELLKEQHGYSDIDLLKKVTDIDMRDGRLDGKVAKDGPKVCPHCNRATTKSAPVCIYCGKPVITDVFDR